MDWICIPDVSPLFREDDLDGRRVPQVRVALRGGDLDRGRPATVLVLYVNDGSGEGGAPWMVWMVVQQD